MLMTATAKDGASAVAAAREDAPSSVARRGAPAVVVVTPSPQPPVVVPRRCSSPVSRHPSGIVGCCGGPLTRQVPYRGGDG